MEDAKFEHYIKYMGTKTKLMDLVVEQIHAVYDGGGVCDLFAGSCSLSGVIGREVKMFSNDIQSYSTAFADWLFYSQIRSSF